MGTYEVTVVYPDLPYDECRRFLGSLAASPPSGLDGFRRYGDGVALTYVVTTEHGPELARRLAVQRAAGTWPNHEPGAVSLDEWPEGLTAEEGKSHRRPPGRTD